MPRPRPGRAVVPARARPAWYRRPVVTWTRLPVEERRAQLLEVGLRLFSTRSWDDVAMDDIAAEVGVSKGLLYHYFPSKRDLYVEVVRLASQALVARTAPDPSLPPRARLRASLQAYLDYVEQRSSAYQVALRGGVGSDGAVWRIVEDTRALVVDRLLDGLGVDRPAPTLRLALRGWVGMVEAVSLDWIERRTVGRDRLLDLLTTSLDAVVKAAGLVDPATRALLAAGRPVGSPGGG